MEDEIFLRLKVKVENLDPTADVDTMKEIIVEAFNDEVVILSCEAQGVEVAGVELVEE